MLVAAVCQVIASVDCASQDELFKSFQPGMQVPQLRQCSFCPQDPNFICVSGNGIIRFLRLESSGLRILTSNALRDDSKVVGSLFFAGLFFLVSLLIIAVLTNNGGAQNIVSHAWLRGGDHRLIAATEKGELILLENGELKGQVDTDGDPDCITCLYPYQKVREVSGNLAVLTLWSSW